MLQDVNTEEESDFDKVFKSRGECVECYELCTAVGKYQFSDNFLFIIFVLLTASCDGWC